MPSKPLRPCSYYGCSNLTCDRYCEQHKHKEQQDKAERNRYYDKHKRNKEAKKFYNSTAWRKCREYVLKRDNYLCQCCLRKGIINPADVVHHKEHLQDNPAKALDPENLESLCNVCHNEEHPEKGQKVKAEEKTRKVRVIKSKANPLIT